MVYFIGRLSSYIYIYLFGDFDFNFELNFILNEIKNNPNPILKGITIITVLSIIINFIYDKLLILFREFLNWANKVKLPFKVLRKMVQRKINRKRTLNYNLKQLWSSKGKFNLDGGKIITNDWTEKLKSKMNKGNLTNTALPNQVFNLIIYLLICFTYFNLYVIAICLIICFVQIFYMLVLERAIVFEAIKFKRELK